MSEGTVSQRLREARRTRREDLPTLAQRIGVRQEHLRAIEQGRLADLPPGIYGRAAIRSFAASCGFNPAEILAECESQLTPVDEPISALGRLRGVRQRPSRQPAAGAASLAAAQTGSGSPVGDGVLPSWRLPAAAALDAGVVVALLLVVVVSAITAMMVPLAALAHSGLTFGLMGGLLGCAYFVWFGGLGGRTMGEQVLGVETRNMDHADHAALTLRAIGVRALLAATEDARFIKDLGTWARTMARRPSSVRSAPEPETLPGALNQPS